MCKTYLAIGAALCICAAASAEDLQKVVPADRHVTSVSPYALQQRTEPLVATDRADENSPSRHLLRVPLEDCDPGSLWSQPVEESSWGYATSEVDSIDGANDAIFDDFGCFFNDDPNSTFSWSGGTINSIKFWGVEVTYDGEFSQLLDPNIRFDVAILTWEFGFWAVPELCFYDNLVPAERVDTTVRVGTDDDTILWRYVVNLPTPCVVNQPRAWLVIQGANEGDLSYFGWARSLVGTDRSLAVVDDVIGVYDAASGFSNFAFCLNGTPSTGVTGACCNERTGACNDGVALEDCCTFWARFAPNGTCNNLGDCGAMQGACCDYPVGGCTVTTRAACESNSGRWLGEGSTCEGGPCCYLIGCDQVTEGEGPRYDQDTPDTFNGGCNADPNNPPVISLACSDSYCGTTGTYWSTDGTTKYRDLDYYELDLMNATSPTLIQLTAAAEMETMIAIYASSPEGSCDGALLVATYEITECNVLFEDEYCAEAGRKYWIVVTVTDFALAELEISPNSVYYLQVDCGSCTLPPGACCVDNQCTSPIGRLACLAMGGVFYAEADCATFDCPCLPDQVIWANGLPPATGPRRAAQRWDRGTTSTSDDQWIYSVDDVTFASEATWTGAYFWTREEREGNETGPLFDGRADYIILLPDGAGGAPNTVVTQVEDVPITRYEFNRNSTDVSNLYVLSGLNEVLPAGTYWIGFWPVTPGNFDGRQSFWIVADNNATDGLYQRSNVISSIADWTQEPTQTALAFCLLGSMAPIEGCPGDYDCSGAIDFFDIDLLLAALGGEQAWSTKYEQKFGSPPSCDYLANCDANGDGSVDFFDIDAFLDLLGTSCP